MNFDKAKLKDYISTLALAAIPVIVSYQAEIGAYIPIEYTLLFTIGIGVLSQLMADKRVQTAFEDTSAVVDEAQAKVHEYQEMVAKLQGEIDERQALVNKITGIKEMTEQPVQGQ